MNTPGKTPTQQQHYRRRTPGSTGSDMSLDESIRTGLTPGKTLCQSELLANFGSIASECGGILQNLDGLSMTGALVSVFEITGKKKAVAERRVSDIGYRESLFT